jgi:hypothetical protein
VKMGQPAIRPGLKVRRNEYADRIISFGSLNSPAQMIFRSASGLPFGDGSLVVRMMVSSREFGCAGIWPRHGVLVDRVRETSSPPIANNATLSTSHAIARQEI